MYVASMCTSAAWVELLWATQLNAMAVYSNLEDTSILAFVGGSYGTTARCYDSCKSRQNQLAVPTSGRPRAAVMKMDATSPMLEEIM